MPVVALPYKIPALNELGKIQYVDAGPAEFLTLIDNAKVVLTDSFHGTAFSINFNKSFLTFDRQYGSNQSQASRIRDMLKIFGLSDYFITDENDYKLMEIDYASVNKILNDYRIKSKLYLKEAIDCCK